MTNLKCLKSVNKLYTLMICCLKIVSVTWSFVIAFCRQQHSMMYVVHANKISFSRGFTPQGMLECLPSKLV